MTNKVTQDDLVELSEPLFDEASRQLLQTFSGEILPEFASDVPLIKTIITIGKVFNNAKEYHRIKMMLAFLTGLENGTESLSKFDQLDEKDKRFLRGLITSQLDMQSDERQAEAIGYLIDAYLYKKLDRMTFVGVLSEIKNTNPILYYFNVDSITMSDNQFGGKEATGSTGLLPAVFGHNTITDIGMWDSGGTHKFVVSNLGIAFIEFVYTPMSQKYQI